jgi:hypothetical protein
MIMALWAGCELMITLVGTPLRARAAGRPPIRPPAPSARKFWAPRAACAARIQAADKQSR